jgi:hypothetical protein
MILTFDNGLELVAEVLFLLSIDACHLCTQVRLECIRTVLGFIVPILWFGVWSQWRTNDEMDLNFGFTIAYLRPSRYVAGRQISKNNSRLLDIS